jgi:glycosyltransferase involved in cell wall biosynthesis
MRWYTCTPVAFGGGADFFARDSGLLCRGFQLIGIESRAVMPGVRQVEDEVDLIRTEYANLESADWWRSHELDGVVLYAWGRPKFCKVATAIHQAGIFLVLNQDNGGLVSPLLGFFAWFREQRTLSGAGRVAGGWGRLVKLLVKGLSKGLLWDDPLRVRHLCQGDVIACVTPIAAAHYRRYCRIFGRRELADRVLVLPHPVHPQFQIMGAKRRQVVAVGRWDDACQKRPDRLMEVVECLVRRDPEVVVEIVGGGNEHLHAWHERLSTELRSRVRLRGHMLPAEMVGVYATSQVAYCPSAYESFHIASGEALCCGCSVVAARSASLASFQWFADDGVATLAAQDDAEAHVQALEQELESWDRWQRSPERISRVWRDRLHADHVATRVLELAAGMTSSL